MAIRNDTPIQFLKGVGPRLGNILHKRGVGTVGELLHWYPRSYEDRRAARSISSLVCNEIVSVKATVVNVRSYNLGKSRRKVYDVAVRDESGTIHCKFFRVPYRGYFERFTPGQVVRVIGKVTDYRGSKEFHHPELRDVVEGEEEIDALVPLYTETNGLSPSKIRKLIASAIHELIDAPQAPRKDYARKENGEVPLEEVTPIERLPSWILEKYDLLPLDQALKGIHQPPAEANREFIDMRSSFHRRVIFEEFFWLELFLATRKSGWQREKGVAIQSQGEFVGKARESLPFALTKAQERSLQEIFGDLSRSQPMHRMLQGDVGSGKTLVALLAALEVIEAGYQAAIMVPTEILAEQHNRNAVKVLGELGLRVALLTGQMKSKERQELLSALASGEIHLLVGTHALIQDDVEFKNLALVVIDEQHRFGVHQRSRLKEKGFFPHFLVMTATPIPRTLAMTVYGDLDVSMIDEMPAGRQVIASRVTYESKRRQVMNFMREQIAKGRQAYIVYPLVEESEKIDLKDALSGYQQLCQAMPDIRFALLHGKMKPNEKEEVMRAFRDHQYDVLVSTTVIEVGVDVPNANFMLIEHTERFGLSQLHQLRGRVGRGEHKSFCIFMLGHAVSDESRERARIMEKTTDGFKIAEADLEIRGPGEFLGARQAGLPGFRLANLVRDMDLLQKARQAAFEILEKDPDLRKTENYHLREELLRKHGPSALASVG